MAIVLLMIMHLCIKGSGAQLIKVIQIPRKTVYGISFGFDSGFRIFKRKDEMQCLYYAVKGQRTEEDYVRAFELVTT